MATRFLPIELENSDLFGVRFSGAVGRSDKANLLDLVDKCLANGKVHLVLDMSDLSSIGGGGARILADFQQQLVSSGGEAVIAGASETVRHFLAPKFDDLPLRFFHTVADADEFFHAADYDFEARGVVEVKAAPPAPEPAPGAGDDEEIGAIGFMDDAEDMIPAGDDLLEDPVVGAGPEACAEPEGIAEPAAGAEPEPDPAAGPDEGSLAMNDVLEEFNGPTEDEEAVAPGRRRAHKYTSLPEAVAALGNWSEYEGHEEFAKALGNLLFSHGLADDSLLLTVQDGVLIDANQDWALDVDGDLAHQIVDIGAPLTLLDIQTPDLSDRESSLLEQVTPDIILPIMRDDQLSAILLLNRDGNDAEYSVAEHFALELLMRVLVENQGRAEEKETDRRIADMSGGLNSSSPALTDNALLPSLAAATEDSLAETLLELALNLPEADDRPHFWRLFARHVWRLLPLKNLAFLAPRMHRAQIIAGDSDDWRGMNLGEKKLQHFFRSMERPVEVACLPTFFKEIKESLTKTGSQWIIGLNWDQEFLGTVFISMEDNFQAEEPLDLLTDLFAETSRLLSRFDDSHDIADVNMNLVRVLIAQREQRCHGSDRFTGAICDELHRLANVMGFPPEQERNLIYGCLLRDIGLIAEDDVLMNNPDQMDPTQWPIYRQHPLTGAQLLAGMKLPQTILDVVRCHHERFNGEGFPKGLQGRKIPLAARVVTVVENYVAMTLGTGGHQPTSAEAAAAILRDNLGDRYDPDIVSLFLKAKDADLDDPIGEMVGRPGRVPARV